MILSSCRVRGFCRLPVHSGETDVKSRLAAPGSPVNRLQLKPLPVNTPGMQQRIFTCDGLMHDFRFSVRHFTPPTCLTRQAGRIWPSCLRMQLASQHRIHRMFRLHFTVAAGSSGAKQRYCWSCESCVNNADIPKTTKCWSPSATQTFWPLSASYALLSMLHLQKTDVAEESCGLLER